jgi:hypothetical protein
VVEPARIPNFEPSRGGRRRLLVILLIASVVFGAQWKLAPPAEIATDPLRSWTPWSLLFLLFPVSLGIWAYEQTSMGERPFKVDLLWGVLAGTLTYIALALGVQWLG